MAAPALLGPAAVQTAAGMAAQAAAAAAAGLQQEAALPAHKRAQQQAAVPPASCFWPLRAFAAASAPAAASALPVNSINNFMQRSYAAAWRSSNSACSAAEALKPSQNAFQSVVSNSSVRSALVWHTNLWPRPCRLLWWLLHALHFCLWTWQLRAPLCFLCRLHCLSCRLLLLLLLRVLRLLRVRHIERAVRQLGSCFCHIRCSAGIAAALDSGVCALRPQLTEGGQRGGPCCGTASSPAATVLPVGGRLGGRLGHEHDLQRTVAFQLIGCTILEPNAVSTKCM